MLFTKNEEGRIVPTEEFLLSKGIDLRGRLSANKSANATNIITATCNRASEMIYDFIFDNSINNERQIEMIEESETAQKIVSTAIGKQLIYLLMVGDLSRGKAEDRALAIDNSAISTLKTVIKEYGVSILYSGV